MTYFKTYTNHGWFLCFQHFFNNISLPFLKCEFWLLFFCTALHFSFSLVPAGATTHYLHCASVPYHRVQWLMGVWFHTWLPLAIWQRAQRWDWPITSDQAEEVRGGLGGEAWMLVADKLTCCGTLKELLLPCLQIYTNTPTHLMFLLISWGAIAPSPAVQSFCLCPSLYLLLVIYLGDAIRAAPTAAVALEMYWRSTQES